MNFSTRLAEKLPGAAFSYLALRLGLQKNMVWSLQRAEPCVVHPATEAYAQEAIIAIRSEKVISVPTDTLYGFACDACSLEAVNRIYEIKGRKLTSPLAICVGDVSDIKRVATTNHLPHEVRGGVQDQQYTVDLSNSGKYKVIRPGSAKQETLTILEKYLLEEE
ncbi:BnaCnng65630D [Brassica napus]|uniref:Threonylcarbamoyl-AMP synthase n=1 Tax=Brassica napus TaxID=3708 RepID=A0A078JSQ2_BRANA|nr:unnamed protein product [Brassica napus]CDY69844.1 BnaCnng65630D [Brassica napus]